jgi:hypothetical protein
VDVPSDREGGGGDDRYMFPHARGFPLLHRYVVRRQHDGGDVSMLVATWGKVGGRVSKMSRRGRLVCPLHRLLFVAPLTPSLCVCDVGAWIRRNAGHSGREPRVVQGNGPGHHTCRVCVASTLLGIVSVT